MAVSIGVVEEIIVRGCYCASSCRVASSLLGAEPKGVLGVNGQRARGEVDVLDERGQVVGQVALVVGVLVDDGANLVVTAREQSPKDINQRDQEDDTSGDS